MERLIFAAIAAICIFMGLVALWSELDHRREKPRDRKTKP